MGLHIAAVNRVPFNHGFKASKNQISITMKSFSKKIVAVIFVIVITANPGWSQNTKQSDESFTIENYYKVKWGYADEFITLWKTNHYPLLKKAIEHGDILSVAAEKPKLHSGEDTRWDFKVTIVFKNAKLALTPDLTTPYKKELYPDQDKADQRRTASIRTTARSLGCDGR
jgi:hypothetical protein